MYTLFASFYALFFSFFSCIIPSLIQAFASYLYFIFRVSSSCLSLCIIILYFPFFSLCLACIFLPLLNSLCLLVRHFYLTDSPSTCLSVSFFSHLLVFAWDSHFASCHALSISSSSVISTFFIYTFSYLLCCVFILIVVSFQIHFPVTSSLLL